MVWKSFVRCGIAFCACLFYASLSLAAVVISPAPGTAVVDGDPPHIAVEGLAPGTKITVHVFRQASVYSSLRAPEVAIAHAEAVFSADTRGRVDVDEAMSIDGTYTGVDGLGLLWSGVRMSAGGEPGRAITQGVDLANTADLLVRVETASNPEHWNEVHLRFTDGADAVTVQDVTAPGLAGAFARPKTLAGTERFPAILLLHGSEGGSPEGARATAIRFARLGYAAFAVNYFAWPYAGVKGIPQALVNVPVETLAAARDWLSRQHDVSAETVAVWGASKGAEFALVGAVRYPWIDRVVACVPSSVVWSGFGRPPGDGEIYSSWSIGGKGLPYIPYDDFSDVAKLKWSSAFVHQRNYDAASEDQRAAARIPLERSRASVLLLAAEKDVVWPSASMTRQLEASLRAAGAKDRERSIVFPNASHYICGTGSEPRRLSAVHRPEGDDPAPEADAHAAANGWAATKAFLMQK